MDDDIALLRRLAAGDLPTKLHSPAEIEAARRLKDRGLITVAIPAASKKLDNFGEQDSAHVLALTGPGRAALDGL